LFRDEEAEDGAAVGLGDDLEGGFHGSYILLQAYTCQGIYYPVQARLVRFAARKTCATGHTTDGSVAALW
jgi:hypothetical protein